MEGFLCFFNIFCDLWELLQTEMIYLIENLNMKIDNLKIDAEQQFPQLFELRKIETYVVLMKLGASIREIQVGGVFDWENLYWGDKGMAEDNFAFE